MCDSVPKEHKTVVVCFHLTEVVEIDPDLECHVQCYPSFHSVALLQHPFYLLPFDKTNFTQIVKFSVLSLKIDEKKTCIFLEFMENTVNLLGRMFLHLYPEFVYCVTICYYQCCMPHYYVDATARFYSAFWIYHFVFVRSCA